ncbi:MAG: ribonuclease III [Magnetococcales bacterium]|nr:ribonuclease III [Magnetococcales bacterium]
MTQFDEPTGEGRPGVEEDLRNLEALLGYVFSDKALLQLALTHRSAPRSVDSRVEDPGGNNHNERLEFLGDAVLDLAVSALLYHHFPKASEGLLSTWRASLVNTRTLGDLGEELLLGDHLRMGKGEDLSGGRKKPSILGNSIEAVFGAIYLDGGYDAVLRVTAEKLGSRIRKLKDGRWDKDYKTLLQEKLQGMGRSLPQYRVVRVSGAPHDRLFQVECFVKGQEPGIGTGQSKRMAEQTAAAQVFGTLVQSLAEKERFE